MTSVTSLAHLLWASRSRRREQWLDPVALTRLRAKRLQGLAHAAARVPYYRELFERAGVPPAS